MKLTFSSEVERHWTELRARFALKTNLSVFNANFALSSAPRLASKSTPNSECSEWISTSKQSAQSKEQSANMMATSNEGW